jgi:hypothetical protein
MSVDFTGGIEPLLKCRIAEPFRHFHCYAHPEARLHLTLFPLKRPCVVEHKLSATVEERRFSAA